MKGHRSTAEYEARGGAVVAEATARPSGTGRGRIWDGAAVRDRVAAMAELDPGLQRFGSSTHRYRLRPPLTEQEVDSFEQEFGVGLPESYRGFLTDVADGGAGPHHGLIGLAEDLDDEDAVYDLREEYRRPGFLATPFPYTRACPGPGKPGTSDYSVSGTLVIAEYGCGMFSRLVVTGKSAGQVWFDDSDWGGLSPGPDFHSWYSAWLESAG
ncbi:SMI1/KNR4 family protein [Streptomyces sp. LN785]|uniref:SMI1/KNR4 family protein n=1 Tax=Streptomyces sp. LN785 TaxID=3112983 RepID=UPI00371A3DD3